MKHFVPGQSLWYGRLAFKPLFLDKLEEMIRGSDTRKRWREAEKRVRKQQHRGFWWKPVEATPR